VISTTATKKDLDKKVKKEFLNLEQGCYSPNS